MRHTEKLAIMAALVLTLTTEPSLTASSKMGASHAGSSEEKRAVTKTIAGTVIAFAPKSQTILVEGPREKGNSLIVDASVTDQTVIKEGDAERRPTDLKVGDHVWMKFERVRYADVAKVIIIKPEITLSSRSTQR